MRTILSLFFAFQAQAGIFDYDRNAPLMVENYIREMSYGSKPAGEARCSSMYDRMISDRVLEIHYAFGYFDYSETGQEFYHGGTFYGHSPSFDPATFEALRKTITSRCLQKHMRLCNFKQIGNPAQGKVILEKQIQIHGLDTLVRITLTRGSVSEFFSKNTGALSAQQKMFTAQSEENFFGGLKTADVVFYNGHSRDGGGPDFTPPVLNRARKADYAGYYHIKKPGIRKTLPLLKENPNPGFILGLFSCASQRHFFKSIMAENPQQRLILTTDLGDYFDSLKASVGYLEGILRGHCGQDLANTAKRGESIQKIFMQYQMN